MKFIHVTDLHLLPEGGALWGLDPFERFEACLADLEAHHADAAFVAITGDLTDKGDEASYIRLKERLARFPLPCHLILGNHDDRANFRAVFSDRPVDDNGFVQFAIDTDGRSLLFLDTLKGPPSSAGLYCPARREWLAEQLDAADGKAVYLFMHHPPFGISHPLMDKIMLDDPEDFAEIISGYDVRHIFFGHGHRAVSGVWRGIAYSALPSTNHQLPLVGGSVETVYSDEPPAYAVVHLSEEQTIIHNDAFLDRRPARMPVEAERDDWY